MVKCSAALLEHTYGSHCWKLGKTLLTNSVFKIYLALFRGGSGKERILVFFSPSGVKNAAAALMVGSSSEAVGAAMMVAIGHTTGRSIRRD